MTLDVQQAAGLAESALWHRDPLVREVAEGKRQLRLDPQPRLVVFGFDVDQRGGILGGHLDRLETEFGLNIHKIGKPSTKAGNAFRRR